MSIATSMSKQPRVSIRLQPDEHDAIQSIAETYDISSSQLIRKCVAYCIEEMQTHKNVQLQDQVLSQKKLRKQQKPRKFGSTDADQKIINELLEQRDRGATWNQICVYLKTWHGLEYNPSYIRRIIGKSNT